jgi:hypothetical protein
MELEHDNEKKGLLRALIVPIQVVLAGLAWRDLARRTDDQVRGKRPSGGSS